MFKFFNLLAESSDSATAGKDNTTMWIVLLVVAALFIVFNIVTSIKARKKQQEAAEKTAERYKTIKNGDKILTIGLIYGTVVEVLPDETFVLETGTEEHKGYIRINKEAIYSLGQDGQEPVLANNDYNYGQNSNNENSTTTSNSDVNEIFPEEKTDETIKSESAVEEKSAEEAKNVDGSFSFNDEKPAVDSTVDDKKD